jgi:hypothetical protein
VPEYNAGAMENAGCVVFRDEFVFRSKVTDTARQDRAEVILHEMAHMWFGDLVTMRWWDDLWLNESFATYAAAVGLTFATRWTEAWTHFINRWKAFGYVQDQLPSTHPVVADIADLDQVYANFDGIAYAKGASVLKQLAAYVGYDEFFAGLRHYFKRHAWGNTTLADLLTALEETSGRDMSAWARAWLSTAGVNTLRPSLKVDDDGAITSFAVIQEADPAWPTLRTHRIAIGVYDKMPAGAADRADDSAESPRLVRRHRIELDVSGERTEVPELMGVTRGDLSCSTTTTSPTPRSGSIRCRSRPRSAPSPPSIPPWPGRCAGSRRGTWSAMARCGRVTTSPWFSAVSAQSRTSRSSMHCWAAGRRPRWTSTPIPPGDRWVSAWWRPGCASCLQPPSPAVITSLPGYARSSGRPSARKTCRSSVAC